MLHNAALSFMINDQDAPTGRPAGSLTWAGLANLFYWIDRKNGVGGFWATQILPSSTRRRWAAISSSRAPSMARRCARPPEACPSPARVAPEMGAGDVGLVQHCCRFVELLEDYVSTSPDP